ncbi:hypothetical protein CANINC_000392 [Pichia inconspicua]|uniref:Uncharacterized protein n=1 Tax=Pichia inconspicua TaxID=52247 RepID=A0A4T0X6B2_9ASCO|nr:hypothetical protein CANINC_000392 [[Candida] inconspicua]
MSTRIITNKELSENDIRSLIEKQAANEISWYISEVINSQVDSVKDVLSYCIRNLDEDDETPYKLPLSSHNSEFLKGTITRTNFTITELHLIVSCPHFNNGKKFEFTLKPESRLIIRQLLDCHDSLESAIFSLEKLAESANGKYDPKLFIQYIEKLSNHIQNARNSLSNPNPAYIFPQFRIDGNCFEPALPMTGALDFTVDNGDLVVDFKTLSIVEKKPWCMIVDTKNKKSFADFVRQKISVRRNTPITQIIQEEYNHYLEWRKHNPDDTNTDNGLGSAIKSIFGANSDPSLASLMKHAPEFLEQAITFVDDNNNPLVVQISHKCEVVTADPVLLSISIKLESIEKNVLRIRDNISNIYTSV